MVVQSDPVLVLLALIDPNSGIPQTMQDMSIWVAALAAGLMGLMTIHRHVVAPTWHGLRTGLHEAREAIRTVLTMPEKFDRIDERQDATDERLERMEIRLENSATARDTAARRHLDDIVDERR